jgi:hypothetical protein
LRTLLRLDGKCGFVSSFVSQPCALLNFKSEDQVLCNHELPHSFVKQGGVGVGNSNKSEELLEEDGQVAVSKEFALQLG